MDIEKRAEELAKWMADNWVGTPKAQAGVIAALIREAVAEVTPRGNYCMFDGNYYRVVGIQYDEHGEPLNLVCGSRVEAAEAAGRGEV